VQADVAAVGNDVEQGLRPREAEQRLALELGQLRDWLPGAALAAPGLGWGQTALSKRRSVARPSK